MLSHEPQGTPESGGSLSAAEAASPPDLWRRWRRKVLLAPLTGDPGEAGRQIEVDTIVASRQAWEASLERLEPDWAPYDDEGLILAQRVTG